MSKPESWPVEREATWLYDGTVPVRVRIRASPEMWGSGDYEDEEAIAQNQPIPCYFLAYESAGSLGVFNNFIPNLTTIEEATETAEVRFGIRWATT